MYLEWKDMAHIKFSEEQGQNQQNQQNQGDNRSQQQKNSQSNAGAATTVAISHTPPPAPQMMMMRPPLSMGMPMPMPFVPHNVNVRANLPLPAILPPLMTVPVPTTPGFVYMDSPSDIDAARTHALEKFLEDVGLMLTPEEETKRRDVLDRLEQIVKRWLLRVALQKGLSKDIRRHCNAKIFTFGSYQLGVHGRESDIDALCVGPNYATLEDDFFDVLFNILKNTTDISEVQCVKSANVPLMRFKFSGISIDLLYARLSFETIPDDLDILDDKLLEDIDETSIKSLNGCRATGRILHLVPNLEHFRMTLRCIKYWAKARGIYLHSFGFLGGFHWAVLVARVCQLFPKASVSMLVSRFFWVYTQWNWSTPVTLVDAKPDKSDGQDRYQYMQIMLPVHPYTSCSYNVTKGTLQKLINEFSRGWKMILEMESDWNSPPNSTNWTKLFEQFPFFSRYDYFIQICLKATSKDDLPTWRGWVESRFKYLILRFEKLQAFCDPSPTPYFNNNDSDPHCYFFWGLGLRRNIRVDMSALEEEFRNILNNGYEGPAECKICLTLLNAFQLPPFVHSKASELQRYSKPYGNNVNNFYYRRAPRYSQYSPVYFVGYTTYPNEAPGY